jgi:GT2 family glycosyltransferase
MLDLQGVTREMLVAVIIVNFRTPGLTIDCLRSVAPEIGVPPEFHVFVVENGSGDDSAVRLRTAIDKEGWQSWCSLEVSDTNRGFSGGNNFGIGAARRRGGARYFLLLNSDTIVWPGCFKRCFAIMETESDVGALSCRVLNSDGSIQNVCRKFPTPLRCLVGALRLPRRFPRWFSWADCDDPSWDRNSIARDVEWIGGAFMMLRGHWIEGNNGLNERFFFYGEDVELCHRIWRSGFRCHYDPTATIVHLGGSSSDPSRMEVDTRSYHQWRGRYLIQETCYGRAAQAFLQSVDLLAAAGRVIRTSVSKRSDAARYAASKNMLRFLAKNWNRWGGIES